MKKLPYIIINETYHPTEGHLDEYVELFSDDIKLEMMAKLACTEIITKSSSRWPGFESSETKCLYIMPGGDEWMRQMTRWADEFAMTARLDPDPCGLKQFKSALFA